MLAPLVCAPALTHTGLLLVQAYAGPLVYVHLVLLLLSILTLTGLLFA